jgi:hypothetical protein
MSRASIVRTRDEATHRLGWFDRAEIADDTAPAKLVAARQLFGREFAP